MIEKHPYTRIKYCLRTLFMEMINIRSVEYLHQRGGFENVGDTPGNDNNSSWHQLFYDKMKGSAFMTAYVQFMKIEIAPKFSEAIIYQKYPTLRIQIPDGKGVATYHIDSQYNHPVDEVNIWLPLTHAEGTRSIYIESEPGKGDYTAQDVAYGEYLMFEGGKLAHGNEVNTTGQTRISIDMRVIPLSKYQPSDMKGLAYGRARTHEGENAYYELMDKS